MKIILFIVLVVVACAANIRYGMFHDNEHNENIKVITELIAGVAETAIVYMYLSK